MVLVLAPMWEMITAGDDEVCFNRVKAFAGRGKHLTDQQVEQIVSSYQGQQMP